jgi:heterodisulfide reductase subunit A-like polyferredoxin
MGAALGWLSTFSPIRLTNRTPCTHCGACRTICPMRALDDGHIDHSSCTYCGRCTDTCGFGWEDIREQRQDDEPPENTPAPRPEAHA